MPSLKFNKNSLYYVKDILVTVHSMDVKYHIPLFTHNRKIESVNPIYEVIDGIKMINSLIVETSDSSIEIHTDSRNGKDVVLTNFYQLVHCNEKKTDTKNVELVMEIDVYINPVDFHILKKDNKLIALNTTDWYSLKKLVI
jgi:hypothetical protein